MNDPERFEKFYFAKVGLGEACGCAEKIIDVFEFNRQGGSSAKLGLKSLKSRRKSLRSFALKYGLISRKRLS
ncbi:hypothetical protein [Ruegeria arenilitoris]|uniref:hypothetical protein n=1 Tax=Ruegeria arenilitoris TaxID=1173585 RepID=UPI00147B87F2|nr:hypothetical protein [Ruegeria arenilitoris]